jgi:1,4-alpha-glucan branching enzyme
VQRSDYKIGVPYEGKYKLVFNSDDKKFGGSGVCEKSLETIEEPMHGFDQCISLELAPLSVMYFKYVASSKKKKTATKKSDTSTKAKDEPTEDDTKTKVKKSAKPKVTSPTNEE